MTIIDDFVTTEHHSSAAQPRQPVRLGDQTLFMRADGSVIWDNTSPDPHDLPLKLLSTFEGILISSDDSETVGQLVRDITAHPLCAVIWRRLLRAGTRKPSSVGLELGSLAWDHTILTARDTTQPAGEFLRVVFSLLDPAERELVERAIMTIPQGDASTHQAAAIRQRDRLLGCVDPTLMVTPAAIEHRAALDGQGGPPANPPEFQVQFGALALDPLYALRAEGVNVEDSETQTILNLIGPAAAFTAQHRNSVPSDEQIAEFLPELTVMATTVASSDLPTALENQVLSDMADAAARALASRTYQWDVAELTMIRRFLMRAINLPADPTSPEHDEQFAKSPAWGMPDARVTAAEALLLLGREPTMMNEELADLILTLTDDPDVAVRYQTAVHLNVISITAPALAWAALDAIVHREHNQSVLNAVLRPLQIVGRSEATKVASFLEDLFQRTSNASGNGDKVYLNCAKILMDLALWEGEDRGTAFIGRLIEAPEQYHEELCHVAFHLAQGLCSDRTDIAARAFWFLERILDALLEALRAIEIRCGEGEGPWPLEARETYGGVLRAVDQIALRLSMDAGAYGHGLANTDTLDPAMLARRDAFYPHARSMLSKLASIGHPHTAHKTMELLAYLSPVDPAGTLILAGTLIRAAALRGYQYDPLGEPLVVGYVERFLAEYRGVLRERPDCNRALVDILDVFVRVGWPSAHRLVYRLDEIYR